MEVEDSGNYICTRTLSDGKVEKNKHELEIITFPIYKMRMNIYYAINHSCSLSDGDILYVYLPKIFGVLICGQDLKSCSVDIDRPRCFTKVRKIVK